MALGSTQPLTEMNTRIISWGKVGRCVRLTNLPPSCAVFTQSRNLNFLEPSAHLGSVTKLIYIFKETWIFWTDFRKILKGKLSWGSVQWEQICSVGTDRQTDVTKPIVAFGKLWEPLIKIYILNNLAIGGIYWIALARDGNRRRAPLQRVQSGSGPNTVHGLMVTGFFLGDKAVGA